MTYITYVPKQFRDSTLAVISDANEIIDDYRGQGFTLTLRQLYYQFVARGLLDNTQREYKRLGSIINDARLAGEVSWDSIEDRTRSLRGLTTWRDPNSIIRGAARSFRTDKWIDQPVRVEVWIEKEALAGVFQRVCNEVEVDFFCCRGYPSQSEVWGASQRLMDYSDRDQEVVVLHFGDHDPSGIDMTRDILDRLRLFGATLNVWRLALNFDQVEEHEPPPNPAKTTDSRYQGYSSTYGEESWELDALEPTMLADLVRSEVEQLRDEELWQDAVESDERERHILTEASERWGEVTDFLEGVS